MPLYIDRHESQVRRSVTELAALHERDVIQGPEFGVRWLTYFCDSISLYSSEGPSVRYTTYCVAEGPTKEAVQACHFAAHERVANEVMEVDRDMLELFLGHLEEPRRLEFLDQNAFRTILVSEVDNAARLLRDLGDRRALEAFDLHERIVREQVQARGGKEVRRTDYGLMACFISAAMALECAMAIRAEVERLSPPGPAAFSVRIGVNAGEPVNSHGDLFGAAVELARAVCQIGAGNSVLVTGVVRDICLGKAFEFSELSSLLREGYPEPVRVFALSGHAEAPAKQAAANIHSLTDREIEVLRLIVAGKSNHQIAEGLVISLNTVARHVANILGKTGVSNRTEAATYALRQGLA